jgi:hypothetical protein
MASTPLLFNLECCDHSLWRLDGSGMIHIGG